MVDDLVGACRFHLVNTVRAGGGDDVGAGVPGQLHGVATDRPARAVDQHALAAHQPGMLEERLPGGETDRGQGGGVGQRDAGGGRGQDLGGGHHIFRRGAGAGHREEADDPVAGPDAGDVVTQRLDRAGDVDAGCVRQGHRDRALHEARSDVAVDRVERGGGHPDQDLTGAGDRLLHVLVTQDARVAVLVETHCLHGGTRFRHVLRTRSICREQ